MSTTMEAAPLPSFGEAMPLGDADAPFLDEMRAVMAKYGNLDRFGLSLLHEHFEVAADEIMLETNDPDQRTTTCTTEKTATLPPYKETMWQLHPYRALQGCAQDKCK
jgi:hypothetical protein